EGQAADPAAGSRDAAADVPGAAHPREERPLQRQGQEDDLRRQRPASGHAFQVGVTNPPILATRNLGLDIGGARIVVDVSLEVAEGELLGIIGPNGAGKTSLFNLFSGLYRATSGSIELGGVDITSQATFRRTREGVGRTFQVSSVFPLLTTFENARLAAEA